MVLCSSIAALEGPAIASRKTAEASSQATDGFAYAKVFGSAK